jgi:hypothetical protein
MIWIYSSCVESENIKWKKYRRKRRLYVLILTRHISFQSFYIRYFHIQHFFAWEEGWWTCRHNFFDTYFSTFSHSICLSIFLILTFRFFTFNMHVNFFDTSLSTFSHRICLSIFLILIFRYFHIQYSCQFFW